MKQTGRYFRDIDLPLMFAVLLLSVFSVVAIRSATLASGATRYVMVQSIAIGLGILAAVIISLFDYEIFCDLSIPIVAASCALLLITAIFAENIDGNKNWLNLGIFNLQGSEFTKMAFAITMGTHLERVGKEINKVRNLLALLVHFGLYVIPIVLQKDIGSVLIYLGTFCILLFAAGIYYRYIAIALVLGVSSVPVIWQFLSVYQKSRIIYGLQPELDPLDYGYQPLISHLMIGSGQMNGMGYLQGIQTQNGSLPAARTDFIFSVVGEEFGFIGCIAVILVLFLIVFLIGKDAFLAKTPAGAYICLTVASVIALQTAVNIGMCIGVSPVIGVTLPFMSYGGSSVLSLFVGIGLVQSVRRKPEKVLSFHMAES